MSASRLVLWDVDGTLLRAGPIARTAFDRAAAGALGRHPGSHGVEMSGKTDPQIALEILAFAGTASPDGDGHLPEVLTRLEAELAGAEAEIRAHGRLMPGVPEVLALLDERPGVHQSVLTGNVAPNALIKLDAFGLTRWLDTEIGAYGSDHADRSCLVPVALERARRLRGLELAPQEVWVVGDTPHDLACARSGGARCLLVGTGRIHLRALRASGPDAVLDDLSDASGVADLLTS